MPVSDRGIHKLGCVNFSITNTHGGIMVNHDQVLVPGADAVAAATQVR